MEILWWRSRAGAELCLVHGWRNGDGRGAPADGCRPRLVCRIDRGFQRRREGGYPVAALRHGRELHLVYGWGGGHGRRAPGAGRGPELEDREPIERAAVSSG